jgi:hypothetical protein
VVASSVSMRAYAAAPRGASGKTVLGMATRKPRGGHC